MLRVHGERTEGMGEGGREGRPDSHLLLIKNFAITSSQLNHISGEREKKNKEEKKIMYIA